MVPDDALDHLNVSERELLLLLGRGHTAKSIATLKDLSELAVNERFRSARRKTGIGSSREIARLLVARENRDDFIGLAEPAAPPASLDRPDAPRRASPQRWRLPMAAAFLLATALFAQQTSVPPAPPTRPVPPAVAAIFAPQEPSQDVAALHAEIATGPADPAWSAATETALSRAYRGVTDPSGAVASLDVTCNASLCEVIGVSRSGLSDAEVNALTEAVQGRDVNEAVTAMNLQNVMQSFHATGNGAAASAPLAIVFVAYWRRSGGT